MWQKLCQLFLLVSAGASPWITPQSLVWRTLYTKILAQVQLSSDPLSPNLPCFLWEGTALQLQCFFFVLIFIISAVEIMKSCKACGESYCMTEQVGIWSLAQGRFDSAHGCWWTSAGCRGNWTCEHIPVLATRRQSCSGGWNNLIDWVKAQWEEPKNWRVSEDWW